MCRGGAAVAALVVVTGPQAPVIYSAGRVIYSVGCVIYSVGRVITSGAAMTFVWSCYLNREVIYHALGDVIANGLPLVHVIANTLQYIFR